MFVNLSSGIWQSMDVDKLKSWLFVTMESRDSQSMVKCKSAVSSFFLFHFECKTMCSCLLVVAGKKTKPSGNILRPSSVKCCDWTKFESLYWLNDRTTEVPWPDNTFSFNFCGSGHTHPILPQFIPQNTRPILATKKCLFEEGVRNIMHSWSYF